MSDYYTKYLKYKSKYLKLKYGGNNDKRLYFIATHNNRLTCFFTKILGEESKKFKNCTVIRCYFVNKVLHFEMIYEGELDQSEAKDPSKYWTITDFNNKKITMSKGLVNITGKAVDMNFGDFSNFKFDGNVEIYLVRHGKGVHNGAEGSDKFVLDRNKFFDAELVDIGKNQAKKAAGELVKFLETKFKNISLNMFFGASHLKRTRQTIGTFIGILGEKILKAKLNKTIYIVPCVHELAYSSDGNCDGSLFAGLELGKENSPKCGSPESIHKQKECSAERYCTKEICENVTYNVHWDYYLHFYGNKQRCRDVNFIWLILHLFADKN